MARTTLLSLILAAAAALQTQDSDGSTKTLRNGVVMPTIAAGTGGYDNQQGKVLRNGLVMPTMSAGTWQYDDDEAEAPAARTKPRLKKVKVERTGPLRRSTREGIKKKKGFYSQRAMELEAWKGTGTKDDPYDAR